MAKKPVRHIIIPAPRKPRNPATGCYEYTKDEFFEEYWKKLFKVFYSIIKHKQDAEDMTQMTCERFLKSWNSVYWDRPDALLSIIAKAVKADYIAYLNNRSKETPTDIDYDSEFDDEGLRDPLRELISDQASYYVHEFIGTIQKDVKRELFISYFITKEPKKETCKRLKISPGNYYALSSRLKADFKEYVEGLDLVPEPFHHGGMCEE